MSEPLSRTSALASRHTALGSGLEDWNGMGTAWSYDTDPNAEHDAVRERVGMFDMSPLKKVMVNGSDAAAVLNHLTTRDISRINPGQAAYLCVLTENGTIADDAIVSNNGDDEWMVVHGSGDTMALLTESARGKNVSIELDDRLHNISVQGPDALAVINANASIDVANLPYFHHQMAEVFGLACRISRTGYSGERGYELFVDEDNVCELWDKLVQADVMPCSFAALDKVRIEAGLLFYGYDMTSEHTPWEVGLGFTVHADKPEFRGKSALLAARDKQNIFNVCVEIKHPEMVAGGESLSIAGTEVGIINSPAYSHRLGKSLALAHVSPAAAKPATELTVAGEGFQTTAKIVEMPIYDPQKIRTHAK